MAIMRAYLFEGVVAEEVDLVVGVNFTPCNGSVMAVCIAMM